MTEKHTRKQVCMCCGTGKATSKEHVFPQWLIKRTGSNNNTIRWLGGRKVNPMAATVPLCHACNTALNIHLEIPVQRIFDRLEGDGRINDYDAELLVRWLWKISKMLYLMTFPEGEVMSSPTVDLATGRKDRDELTRSAHLADHVAAEHLRTRPLSDR